MATWPSADRVGTTAAGSRSLIPGGAHARGRAPAPMRGGAGIARVALLYPKQIEYQVLDSRRSGVGSCLSARDLASDFDEQSEAIALHIDAGAVL